MAELGRLHGTSLTKMSEIPTDMPRLLEPDGEEIRRAFPAFAKTWGSFLGEEGLKRYERAVDAYEKKWLVQKDEFVQGLVHGDYRMGNVIFGREGPEEETQDQAGQGYDFAGYIKASIAQRPLANAGVGAHAAQAGSKATLNERVEEAAGRTLENPGGVQATGSASEPEIAPESNVKNVSSTTQDSGSYGQPSSAASSNNDISKLKFRHVDWQTVSRGPIFADVAYFLSMSLDSKTRRACEVDLLYAWYTACREAAGEYFPADLNITRCVHEISIACIKSVLTSVTTVNNLQAPEMAMRMLGGRLNIISQILVDWRSFD